MGEESVQRAPKLLPGLGRGSEVPDEKYEYKYKYKYCKISSRFDKSVISRDYCIEGALHSRDTCCDYLHSHLFASVNQLGTYQALRTCLGGPRDPRPCKSLLVDLTYHARPGIIGIDDVCRQVVAVEGDPFWRNTSSQP
jgi:hypothetical protein